jgi:hypothetical protein
VARRSALAALQPVQALRERPSQKVIIIMMVALLKLFRKGFSGLKMMMVSFWAYEYAIIIIIIIIIFNFTI